MASRQYDLVLFGATGYTGKFTAQHIASSLPTDLNWAIAGRSQEKLSRIAKSLKSQNPDRKQPEIETAQLNSHDLNQLASKTKVLINAVGPYCLHGEPVVAACADKGTHYLDFTGEVPWVRDMINKYHSKAKSTGAIIMPQSGVESVPADMITFSLVKHIRDTLSMPTQDVICSIHDGKGSASGGTLATVLTLFTRYSLREAAQASSSSGLSPVPVPSSRSSIDTTFSRFFGVRSVPDLGTLTTSFFSAADVPHVYRSWGLSTLRGGESYGSNFHFRALMNVRNTFLGAVAHLALNIMPLMLVLPPVRWALSKFVYQPGQGPTEEDTRHDYIEYRALGLPEGDTRSKAFARFRWEGSSYHLTGVVVAEAAATVLYNEAEAKERLEGGGGVVTPAAALGQAYLDRLDKAGVRIEVKTLRH